MTSIFLPQGFEDLAKFAAHWSLPTTDARRRARHAHSIEEIRAFYDAAFAHITSALTYLDQIRYDEKMTPVDVNLMNLYLAFAEITTAVEWYGQPAVADGYEPFKVRMPVELP